MRSAESAGAQNNEDTVDQELATWREEIRRHALAELARQPAKPPRLLRIGALASLLLVHAALLIGLRNAMQRPLPPGETAVAVRFLDANLPEPPLPVPTPSTPRSTVIASHVTARVIVPVAPSAAPTAAPSKTAMLQQLFNPDGSIRLPAAPPPRAPTTLQSSAELMQRGHNLVHCRQTRFAGGYKRAESVGDQVARNYLRWIGLYNPATEARAQRREAAAAAACDG